MRHLLFAASVLLASGLALANPVIEVYFSELQTAPDSQERIELRAINTQRPFPLDLYNWRLSTDAGVCTVNTHLILADSTSYVVLDATNLSPGLTLGDFTDSLVLFDETGTPVDAIGYPLRSTYFHCLAPPAGASAALYYSRRWVGGEPADYFAWYTDPSPTFAAPNDDTIGGIRGTVRDDHGLPVRTAMVTASCPAGQLTAWTDSLGCYEFHPTGPGTFFLRAQHSTCIPGCYPESVTVAVNAWAENIDILLTRVGITTVATTSPFAPAISQHGRRLAVSGSGRLTVFDQSGRSLLTATGTGNWEIDISPLRPGIYFVRLLRGRSTLCRKLVLY